MNSKISSHKSNVFKQLLFLAGIFFKRQKKLLLISIILGFFAETLAMFMPQLTGNLAATLSDWHEFRTAAFLFLTAGVIQFVFAVTNDVFDRLLKDRLERDTYCVTHEKLLTMDPEYYQRHTSGEMLLNLNSASGIAYELLELICFPVFYGSGMAVGLILLFRSLQSINLPLWLILTIVAGMAIQPFLTWYFGKLIAKAYTKVRASGQEINEEILNDLHAPLEMRFLNAVKKRLSRMFSIQHKLALRMDKAMLLHIASRYSMSMLILLFQFAIVISVLLNYHTQKSVIGDLIASILLIPMMFTHLNKLQQMYNGVKDREPYIDAVYGLFQTGHIIPAGTKNFPQSSKNKVVFKDIGFSYDGKQQILKNLDLALSSGNIHAIVAPAGEGKTTILKLIARMYSPQSGIISVNGEDIFAIKEDSYRQHCLICSQSPLFIKGTIRDNFKLQKSNISDPEIIELCKKTGLAKSLEIPENALPDFELSLGADKLSGGQRKMLALARCFSLSPEILLLDEPSAGIDGPTINEYLIPFLKSVKDRMIMVIIDHNIGLVTSVADEIHVLANGAIQEQGTPSELLKNTDGLLYSLHSQWLAMHEQRKTGQYRDNK